MNKTCHVYEAIAVAEWDGDFFFFFFPQMTSIQKTYCLWETVLEQYLVMLRSRPNDALSIVLELC